MTEIEALKRDRRWVEELAAWLIGYRQCLERKIARLEKESETRTLERLFGRK